MPRRGGARVTVLKSCQLGRAHICLSLALRTGNKSDTLSCPVVFCRGHAGGSPSSRPGSPSMPCQHMPPRIRGASPSDSPRFPRGPVGALTPHLGSGALVLVRQTNTPSNSGPQWGGRGRGRGQRAGTGGELRHYSALGRLLPPSAHLLLRGWDPRSASPTANDTWENAFIGSAGLGRNRSAGLWVWG